MKTTKLFFIAFVIATILYPCKDSPEEEIMCELWMR